MLKLMLFYLCLFLQTTTGLSNTAEKSSDETNLFVPTRGKKMEFKQSVPETNSDLQICMRYRDNLSDYQYSLDTVKRFRRDLITEHYTTLLERYGEFWNYVRERWLSISLIEKQFLTKFKREYLYLNQYLTGTDRVERDRKITALKDKYKEQFSDFAQKNFSAKKFDIEGWAYAIRNGRAGSVFPYGSVIEMGDGELMISRYARIQLNPEFGGFTIVAKIENDINGSLVQVVSSRGNFRAQRPSEVEMLASARRWTRVYREENELDEKEQRLRLLLDERYEHCIAAAKQNQKKKPRVYKSPKDRSK